MPPEAAESLILAVAVLWLLRFARSTQRVPPIVMSFAAAYLAIPAVVLGARAMGMGPVVETFKWVAVATNGGLTVTMIAVTAMAERRERRAHVVNLVREAERRHRTEARTAAYAYAAIVLHGNAPAWPQIPQS